MRIFMDCEFTGLHKDTTLISIGLTAENNDTFYAEFNDYDNNQIDTWLNDNVLKNCRFITLKEYPDEFNNEYYNNNTVIAEKLTEWLNSFNESIEIWSDYLAYDWVLFCNIFGYAFNIPRCVSYIPFDLCTLMKIKGINPDINREEFSNIKEDIKKHNALYDAEIIKICYDKIMDGE